MFLMKPCIDTMQVTADKEVGTAAGRVLLNSLESSCGSQKLFISDRNRTVDMLLPCGGATRGTFQTQRERTLYVSDSESLSVYIQSVGNSAVTTNRLVNTHHMYLLKFQGILHM